jgi:hypothetical protein
MLDARRDLAAGVQRLAQHRAYMSKSSSLPAVHEPA